MDGQRGQKGSTQAGVATATEAAGPVPVVTIDGPAASGKSSVSRELARRLGWSWVSTGAFYRGLAFVAQQLKADLTNEDTLVTIAESNHWQVKMDVETTRVMFQGLDVTEAVNREEVGTIASKVSQFPRVRMALLDAQRRCARGVKGLVAEGRDCGTVVFPQAELKVFLTARAEDRAARRARDEGKSVAETQDAQRLRDSMDANRKTAPMLAPDGSHVIDTSVRTLGEVVSEIEGLFRAR